MAQTIQTTQTDVASAGGWSGTAGMGMMTFPKFSGGRSLRTWPVPLLSINYDETFFVELQRVGVYLLASSDRKIGMGFAVEPRFGYSSKDDTRLSGMATRRSSIEGGPTFDWDLDVIAFSLAYFGDFSRTSDGRSARGAVYRPVIKDDHWDVGALFALDRMSGRLANYYYGVPVAEATASRGPYRAEAGTNITAGFGGTYAIDKRHALMFGINATRLAPTAAKSPIAETRSSNLVYVGYGWIL